MNHFKYKKMRTFYFANGLIGHNDKFCAQLFAKEEDDGVKNWSVDLRVDIRRIGGIEGGK